MPTSVVLPDTIISHTHAHRHTRHDHPQPPQRHVSVMARVTRNIARQQDVPHSHNNTALHKHNNWHTAARTPRTARHTAPTTPHTATEITPNHTHSIRATLTSELSGWSALTGCCRRVGCYSSSSPCTTHEQPSRHTMAPDPRQPPTTNRRASRRIHRIESNESQSAHCMLSITHNTV
jgi:hypothetical protein